MAAERLVDTSVWIDALRAPKPVFMKKFESLVESGDALLCGPVVAELLQGLGREKEQKALLEHLVGLKFLESKREDWVLAGQLSAEARMRGQTLGLTDCLIGALAKRKGCVVLTRDKDFLRLKGVEVELI